MESTTGLVVQEPFAQFGTSYDSGDVVDPTSTAEWEKKAPGTLQRRLEGGFLKYGTIPVKPPPAPSVVKPAGK